MKGLVTVFLEHLVGFGGRVLDDEGRVVVDSPAAVRALSFMRRSIDELKIVPASVLAWQEEQSRFAFQNGQVLFMRNWPYAAALIRDDPRSPAAGHFALAAMPHDGGRSASVLGGAQLAINARSRQPNEAWELVRHLTSPEQMVERARVAGQFPSRPSVYERQSTHRCPADGSSRSQGAHRARQFVRPTTPVYTQLSGRPAGPSASCSDSPRGTG